MPSRPWLSVVAALGALRCSDPASTPPSPASGGTQATFGGASGASAAGGGNGGQAGRTAGAGSAGMAGNAGIGGAAGSATGGAGAGGAGAGGAGTGSTGDVVTCPTDALAPGNHSGSLAHDGLERSFIVHVPAGYGNQVAVPLVLNFHGATSTDESQQSLSQLDDKADAEGFVVVYPEGSSLYWNAGDCCGAAFENGVDDVGFARALVAHVSERTCVDPKRVFATGFSNGGRLSYRLGCEAADLFAAIAPVAGVKSFPDQTNGPGCTPSRPIPLIDIMGTADERIAAQPGQIAEWLAFNGCAGDGEESYRQGEHFCRKYSECSLGSSVTHCSVQGVGHTWPNVDGFNANDRIWELFSSSSL